MQLRRDFHARPAQVDVHPDRQLRRVEHRLGDRRELRDAEARVQQHDLIRSVRLLSE